MKGPACSPNGRMLVVAGEELLPAAADPPTREGHVKSARLHRRRARSR
ncbi:MAG: hypothetical protein KatS3mg110_4259 [Pirellulaceae bacterium]|nr:MAG: hypothetical protein KatS3mg110_4259 [Pirellulaceae bacterium]